MCAVAALMPEPLQVEELYTVNQQLLIMAAKCRAETLKEKKNSQVFRTKIQELQDQVRGRSVHP